MIIRELTEADVAACVEIVRLNWGDAVAEKAGLEMSHAFMPGLAWPPIYFVAEESGQVCGFAGMMKSWIMAGVWDFIWINCRKEMQGQGIGKQLTLHRISEVKKRGGTMIQLMTKRHGFFTRMKFKTVGVYDEWVLMNMQLGKVVI